MTEIDWSKAPEGAQCARLVQGNTPDFYRTAVEFEFWCEDDNKWKRCGWRSASDADMIHRPTPWTGEGLPPVGTVCEMSIGDPMNGNWVTGTVACHINWDRPVAVAHDNEDVFHGYAEDFRPIRTPEQLAEEEREKAIEAMCDHFMHDACEPIPVIYACARLYDAGYRKTEGGAQ